MPNKATPLRYACAIDPMVELALRGGISVDELSLHQQEEYFDRLEELQELPSEAEEEFFADRRRRGLGVGMDEDGRLIYQRDVNEGQDADPS